MTDESRPLVLSPGFFRRRREGGRERLIIQPPTPEQRAELSSIALRRGIPLDVMLALEAMNHLAEQGNRLAAYLYESECRRLGLWYDKGFSMPSRFALNARARA